MGTWRNTFGSGVGGQFDVSTGAAGRLWGEDTGAPWSGTAVAVIFPDPIDPLGGKTWSQWQQYQAKSFAPSEWGGPPSDALWSGNAAGGPSPNENSQAWGQWPESDLFTPTESSGAVPTSWISGQLPAQAVSDFGQPPAWPASDLGSDLSLNWGEWPSSEFVAPPPAGNNQTLTATPAIIRYVGVGPTINGAATLTATPAIVRYVGVVPSITTTVTLAATPAIVRYVGVNGTVVAGPPPITWNQGQFALQAAPSWALPMDPSADMQAPFGEWPDSIFFPDSSAPAAQTLTAVPAVIRYVGVVGSVVQTGPSIQWLSGQVPESAAPSWGGAFDPIEFGSAGAPAWGPKPASRIITAVPMPQSVTATPAVIRYVGVTAVIQIGAIFATPGIIRFVGVTPSVSTAVTKVATPAIIRYVGVAPAISGSVTRAATPGVIRYVGVVPTRISSITLTGVAAVVKFRGVTATLIPGVVTRIATAARVRYLAVNGGIVATGQKAYFAELLSMPTHTGYSQSGPTHVGVSKSNPSMMGYKGS